MATPMGPSGHATVDTPAATPSASQVASRIIADRFLDRTVIVHIPDGRAFKGTLLCIDNGVNVILANTIELRSIGAGSAATTERNVGMVMVPGRHVVRFEVQDTGDGGNHASSSILPAQYAAMGWPDNPDMYD